MNARDARSAILLATVTVAAVCLPARSQPSAADLLRAEELQRTLAAVADQVRPSVVAIRAFRRFETLPGNGHPTTAPAGSSSPLQGPLIPSIGTGVIIAREGLILTNEHVVHGVEPDAVECILSNGDRYTVQGMTTDPRSDLAVLSVDARDLQPVRWGDVSTLRQGHFVIVLGNPLGTALDADGRPSMSFGIVSALGQDLTQKLNPDRYYGNLIQTDARINPGNSGGPLVNLRGEVIGITTAISSRSGGSDGVGYAIPMSNVTRWVVDQLARGQDVDYGYIGVHLEERTPRPTPGANAAGATISSIEPGSPADLAGVKVGDVVVRFNSQTVASPADLMGMTAMAGTQGSVPVSLLRQGRALELKISPIRRPGITTGVNVEPAFDWRSLTFSPITPYARARFAIPDSASGVLITSVIAGSQADKAGVRPGDVVQQLNGSALRGFRHFRQTIEGLHGPARITLNGKPPREVSLP
jgi:serine protease Do